MRLLALPALSWLPIQALHPRRLKSGLNYNPALDGLRAISIAAVVCSHMMVPGIVGSHGVTVFFVVSGYLITSLLLLELDATGTIHLLHFYWRRFARLGPALIVVVAVTTLLLLAVGQPFARFWVGPIAALTYTTDIVESIWGNTKVTGFFQFTWSLSIEEQFYLAWPMLLLVATRRGGRRQIIGWLIAAFVLSAALRYWQDGPTPECMEQIGSGSEHDCIAFNRLHYGPVTHIGSLVLGCLLSAVLHFHGTQGWTRTVGRIAGPVGVVTTLLLFHYGSVLPLGRIDLNGVTQMSVAATAMVWWVAVSSASCWGWLMSTAPLVVIGKLSYSIYLWNLLIVRIFSQILIHVFGYEGDPRPWNAPWSIAPYLFVLLVVSWLMWRYVETPLRRRWAPPPVAVN